MGGKIKNVLERDLEQARNLIRELEDVNERIGVALVKKVGELDHEKMKPGLSIIDEYKYKNDLACALEANDDLEAELACEQDAVKRYVAKVKALEKEKEYWRQRDCDGTLEFLREQVKSLDALAVKRLAIADARDADRMQAEFECSELREKLARFEQMQVVEVPTRRSKPRTFRHFVDQGFIDIKYGHQPVILLPVKVETKK